MSLSNSSGVLPLLLLLLQAFLCRRLSLLLAAAAASWQQPFFSGGCVKENEDIEEIEHVRFLYHLSAPWKGNCAFIHSLIVKGFLLTPLETVGGKVLLANFYFSEWKKKSFYCNWTLGAFTKSFYISELTLSSPFYLSALRSQVLHSRG